MVATLLCGLVRVGFKGRFVKSMLPVIYTSQQSKGTLTNQDITVRWFMRSAVSHRHLDIGAIAHPDDIPDFKDPRLTYQVDMNKYQAVHMSNEQEIYRELMEGCGYVVIPQCFSPEDVHHARDLVMYFIRKEGKKATHFHGADDSRADLQARVWNLLNKAEIFQKIVQHPKVTRILDNILGDEFQLGSVATNTLFPGATGQEPHIDYPYWDYYERKHWPVTPKVKEVHFHMNMQATLLLDDFTTENGATAVVPGTQVYPEYPHKDEFFKKCVQVTGRAGDMMLFPGIMQHAAMLNKSSAPRTGVIIQYLPKFVKPMEDIRRVLAPEVIASASPRLRKLLCLDYPYPEVLDEAEPVNSEGSQSNFKWK